MGFEAMTMLSLCNLIVPLSAKSGLGRLAPHDLRRTYAKLAYEGGARLEQVQMSLGHASMQTTERYLGAQQGLMDALATISDWICTDPS